MSACGCQPVGNRLWVSGCRCTVGNKMLTSAFERQEVDRRQHGESGGWMCRMLRSWCARASLRSYRRAPKFMTCREDACVKKGGARGRA